MDLRTLRPEYIHWLREVRRLQPGSVQTYESTARQLEEWWGKSDPPELADLEAFVARDRRGQRPTDATIAKDIRALRSYFGWLYRYEHIDKDVTPDLVCPTVRNIAPKAIDDDTWITLWQSRWVSDQDRVWLGLGFFGGLRVGELITVQAHQLSIQQRKLVSFVRKGGGDHTLPIGSILNVYEERLPHLGAERLWPLLCAAQDELAPSAHLCPYINVQRLWRKLRRIQLESGVPIFKPHALRHSMVTNLLRARVPLHLVSRMANHSNVTTTMRYVKAGGDELDEWLRGA